MSATRLLRFTSALELNRAMDYLSPSGGWLGKDLPAGVRARLRAGEALHRV